MIDFSKLENYKENNRIEAKTAVGGLPNSIWETYSAFANTIGGKILLGVNENEDKSLSPIGLNNPQKLIQDFWNLINNTTKVSVNILSNKDVTIETINGKQIVVINVPRAQRSDKPVYLNNNPLSGSFRRNGEGDYRCTKDEVQAMMRDASIKTQDMLVLNNMNLDVFDYESIKRYRSRMKVNHPGHVWEEDDNIDFLYKLGAIGRSTDGDLHPTTAGLLMFGYEYEITKEFPTYFLDYQEQLDSNTRWTDRIVSTSGDWSGNIYDFYFRVYNKITQDIKIPFKIEDGGRIDNTPIHDALREAIANSIINSDYYGRQGLVIIKKKDIITISNPGSFRIDVETAISGGVSDPRNSTLIKMFNLINIGERAGSGIPSIFKIWEKQGWNLPEINESFEPDRITLSLPINKSNYKTTKTGDKSKKTDDKSKKTDDKSKKTGDKSKKTGDKKQAIISYLKKNEVGKATEIAKLLGLKPTRTREILAEMINDGIIDPEGQNKNRTYKLK